MDSRLSKLLRNADLYDTGMIGSYLDELHADPQLNAELRSIVQPGAVDEDDVWAQYNAIKRLTVDTRVKHVLRSHVRRTGCRFLAPMVVVAVALLVVGAGVRMGLPVTNIGTAVGNGLILGGVVSVLVGLVIYARTLLVLPGKEVAAVNLAYAGRVIDGNEIWPVYRPPE